MSQRIILYSDGGARGNPGPAAIAFIATTENGTILKSDSQFIGKHTNNQAEYHALLLALKYAANQKAKEVTCYLDSELVKKQLSGEYSIKNSELQQLNSQIKDLLGNFQKINFVNVPRSNPLITLADAAVNKTLDKEEKKNLQTKPKSNAVGEGSMFVHASIRTSNMKRSIDFYNKFFNLKVVGQHELKATNSEIAFMQDPEAKGCMLELTFYHDQKEFQQPDYEKRLFDHIGFTVTDINATIAEVKKAGIIVTDEPKKFSANTTIAFVEDPDGTLIELIEHK